jgi:hypothetical protein
LDTTGLRLDDLADLSIEWGLGDFFGSSYWWLSAGNPNGGLDAVFDHPDLSKAVLDTNGISWLSETVAMDSMSSPSASIGLTLGSGYVHADLADLTDFRLRVRGKGRWVFSLHTTTSTSEGVSEWDTDSLELDTAWSTIRLAPSSFHPAGVAGVQGWQTSPPRLVDLYFQTTVAGHIDIAEVALEGISLSDWK